MKVVYEYTIGPSHSLIQVPRGSQFLSVGAKGCDAVVWFLCPIGETLVEDRQFIIVRNDQKFGDIYDVYRGTILLYTLFFHIFERISTWS